jgi:hypothetical protein
LTQNRKKKNKTAASERFILISVSSEKKLARRKTQNQKHLASQPD